MAERKARITQAALERLGAPALAALIVDEAEANPGFARRVRLELAGSAAGAKLHQEIDRRLSGLARSSRFVERHEASSLARELDALRVAIGERLGVVDPAGACERLRRLLEQADSTMERADDSDGALADVFDAALRDLGRIWGALPDRSLDEMIEFVLGSLDQDDHGILQNVVTAFQEPLGEAGRSLLKERLEQALAAQPPVTEDWHARSARISYVAALETLADAAGDVDAFIASAAAEPLYDGKRHDIAERLIAAARADEALAWLAECGDFEPERLVDLRLQALDALGRKDEAQALRWTWFERSLSAVHLKEHVRRLPDFEGFEAERRAVRTALAHANRHAALRFLLDLPDLAAADELVRGQIERLNPRDYDLFNLAAERLVGRYPLAAILLWRRKVEDVLGRASSSQYGHAARDLRQAAAAAGAAGAGGQIEQHEAWLSRLRGMHGRKWRFWELVGERR